MSVLGAKPTSHRHVAVVLFWLADVGCQARCAKVSLKSTRNDQDAKAFRFKN